ncbi:MAG: carbamoyltransferase HypF [Candidatus Omnitrophica bacterium]|nr:carbamoyltransferase HypF [Candidatus Omnitrophota bacterium]
MPKKRVRINIKGAVQGVGFRPFIFNLAQKLNLKGFVSNNPVGVLIEAEGEKKPLEEFIKVIPRKCPAASKITAIDCKYLKGVGYGEFVIKVSGRKSEKSVLVLPDIATCPQCLKEIFDKNNIRYLYPFTNCTLCGPRFSIIEKLPYDRKNTSMKTFKMCGDCREEYDNPRDRRFHAQPNACHACGPQLCLIDEKGKPLAFKDEALKLCIQAIKQGKIIALKGLGGFQIIVDAKNERSVRALRERKHREEKPFALMFPDIESVRKFCRVSSTEEKLLNSAEAPIVILEKLAIKKDFYQPIAPGNPCLGVMLPYTPLHHILMRNLKIPIVATSGNLSDEVICYEDDEALQRLKGIADLFLIHDRRIVRHVDDSIVRVVNSKAMVLRRSRGFAPLGIQIKNEIPGILAVGAHLKNTFAVNIKNHVFISQHIGDLETKQTFEVYKQTIAAFKDLYRPKIEAVACDMHPNYLSSRFAQEEGKHLIKIQHHHAHIVSCMAENKLNEEVLGIAWDGTGLGEKEEIWGGEFLSANLKDFKRVGCFRPFALPGGELAVKEPIRSALSLLFEVFKDKAVTLNLPFLKSINPNLARFIIEMLKKDINSPRTTSVGRLFDGVSALIGLSKRSFFEGQPAIMLEHAIEGHKSNSFYPFQIRDRIFGSQKIYEADWEGLIKGIIADLRKKRPVKLISVKFHNTLVEIAVKIAGLINMKKIVLSGGCFQNKYLTERLVKRLKVEGFSVYCHKEVPPNDGGISLGQLVCAANRLRD